MKEERRDGMEEFRTDRHPLTLCYGCKEEANYITLNSIWARDNVPRRHVRLNWSLSQHITRALNPQPV